MSPASTQFASAARADFNDILNQNKYFTHQDLLGQILDSVPNGVIILNQQRQSVYINQAMVRFAGLHSKEEALGLRVGEAIGCQHAFITEGGCGTTEFCRSCGAIKSILIAQEGQANVQECNITREGGDNPLDALDLRVTATPLAANGETLTIFAVTNIADEKRRQVLERIFFHDLRNTASVIHGASEMVERSLGEAPVSRLLSRASHKLMDEIEAQQQLLAAENGRLELQPSHVLSQPLLMDLVGLYELFAQDRGCGLRLAPETENFMLMTDETVLSRVLGNMIKNALEACAAGDMVTVGCREEEGEACFWVHNPAYMRPSVQRQVFLRSFSTKGAQRGLGTYSMRLLSERFLGGRVSFTTDKLAGTTFTAVYPLALPLRQPEKPALSPVFAD